MSTFEDRVRAIPWSTYEASCGNSPDRIPNLLIQMNGSDHERTIHASREIWNLLCHQSNTAPVDVPALPFLLEILDHAPDDLAVEILDMLCSCAATLAWHRRNPHEVIPPWVTALREALTLELPRFHQLAASRDSDIAEFAQMIVNDINLTPDRASGK